MSGKKGMAYLNEAKLSKALSPIKLLFQETLANYTFTKTGGIADVIAFPKNTEEVCQVVQFCTAEALPWQVLGNASNLIVRDGGIRGLVIMLSEMNAVEITENHLRAEAGAKLVNVAKLAADVSLTGLEFACGIPGSIGGAVYMNAGAYDGEISHAFHSAEVITREGQRRTLYKEDMQFAYRYSSLQASGAIVLAVTFGLKHGDPLTIQKRVQELTDLRTSKQPLEYPSCGSVFKRPVGHYTGQLIQAAGLQGLQWGGAQVSEKHAGFIVNRGNATATDYLELIAHIQQVIWEKFGVQLETEVRIIGEE